MDPDKIAELLIESIERSALTKSEALELAYILTARIEGLYDEPQPETNP